MNGGARLAPPNTASTRRERPRPERQRRQRVSADSPESLFWGRRLRKPVALVAGALPSPRVLAKLRRARGKQREQRPTQARAPTEKPASL